MRKMFSENQIAKMIGDGLLENEDVKVKTLAIKEAIELEMEVSNLGGRTFTNRYSKVLVSCGIMYIILSALFKNETEETISSSNVVFTISNIPPEIGAKIICINGESVADDVQESNVQISPFICQRGNTFSSNISSYFFKSGKNKISFNLQIPSLSSLAQEQYAGRTFICLF